MFGLAMPILIVFSAPVCCLQLLKNSDEIIKSIGGIVYKKHCPFVFLSAPKPVFTALYFFAIPAPRTQNGRAVC